MYICTQHNIYYRLYSIYRSVSNKWVQIFSGFLSFFRFSSFGGGGGGVLEGCGGVLVVGAF